MTILFVSHPNLPLSLLFPVAERRLGRIDGREPDAALGASPANATGAPAISTGVRASSPRPPRASSVPTYGGEAAAVARPLLQLDEALERHSGRWAS